MGQGFQTEEQQLGLAILEAVILLVDPIAYIQHNGRHFGGIAKW